MMGYCRGNRDCYDVQNADHGVYIKMICYRMYFIIYIVIIVLGEIKRMATMCRKKESWLRE